MIFQLDPSQAFTTTASVVGAYYIVRIIADTTIGLVNRWYADRVFRRLRAEQEEHDAAGGCEACNPTPTSFTGGNYQ